MRQRRLAAVLLVTLVLVGCIHKTGGQISPWERVTTDNAAFAQLVNDATQGVIALQGTGVLSVDQTKQVLGVLSLAAQNDQQVTAILNVGPTGNLTQAQALLQQIQTSAVALVTCNGCWGIKNPKTQQAIASDIQEVGTLAQAIISDINVAKGVSQ